jgi:hypothetical protein
MRKSLFTLIVFTFLIVKLDAQVVDFESINFDASGVWNGADLSGSYEESGFEFFNSFNPEWSSWKGFSISSQTDQATAGWGNQYSVYTGKAFSGTNFALATSNSKISFDTKVVDGFYITNSTYSVLSMLYGDDFAKKFGGETGEDSDWFKLSIIGKLDGEVKDTLEFYLADYRFEDSSKDYIVSDWTWLDVSKLGNISELSFEFSSSDTGQWGMNTPAYFCMDDLRVNTVGVDDFAYEPFSVYPNPAHDQLTVNIDGIMSIFDLSGKRIITQTVEAGSAVSLMELTGGVYFVKVGSFVEKIIKY